MADITYYRAAALVADTQTDVTDGGLPAGAAGMYMLNVCNDTDAPVVMGAIYVTNGEAPAARHKVRPAATIRARDALTLQPLKLGVGFRVFLQASAAVSVQLLGAKED